MFIIAALHGNEPLSNRVLVVSSQDKWDEVIMTTNNTLILVPEKTFTPQNIGLALEN